jgi:hypothetical protein
VLYTSRESVRQWEPEPVSRICWDPQDRSRLVRPNHEDDTACQLEVDDDKRTVGEAVANVLFYWTAINCKQQQALQKCIDTYFERNPDGTIQVGYYTPRGRKRRGLHTRQRRILCVKVGTERHYLIGVKYYGFPFAATATAITVRCRCSDPYRTPTAPVTTVWHRPA